MTGSVECEPPISDSSLLSLSSLAELGCGSVASSLSLCSIVPFLWPGPCSTSSPRAAAPAQGPGPSLLMFLLAQGAAGAGLEGASCPMTCLLIAGGAQQPLPCSASRGLLAKCDSLRFPCELWCQYQGRLETGLHLQSFPLSVHVPKGRKMTAIFHLMTIFSTSLQNANCN